jgi:hypothetical protein
MSICLSSCSISGTTEWVRTRSQANFILIPICAVLTPAENEAEVKVYLLCQMQLYV